MWLPCFYIRTARCLTKPSPSSCCPSYFVDIKWVKHFTRDQGLIFHRTWVQTSFLHTPPLFLCFIVATSFLYNQIRQAISTTEKKITWNLVETLDTHIKQEFLKWNHFHRLKMSKQNKSQCHNNKWYRKSQHHNDILLYIQAFQTKTAFLEAG